MCLINEKFFKLYRYSTCRAFFIFKNKIAVHLRAVVGQAIKPLKRRRKVSSANAESEPPYNIPIPYLWVYGKERGDNVKVRCGSSGSIGAREPWEYLKQ